MSSPLVPRYGEADFLETYGRAWSQTDDAQLAGVFSEDGVYVESSYGTSYAGRKQIARFFRFMRAFSPDTKIVYITHCGDRSGFALEWVWSGTSSGSIAVDGTIHAATNTHFSIPGIARCRANAAGEITYHRDYYDLHALLKQIGIA